MDGGGASDGGHRRGAPTTDAWRSAAVWDAFTNARRIALIGASDRSRFTANLLAANEALGFGGEILLVNPRRDTVQGRAAVGSLSAIDGAPVDCAILSVPNRVVPESLVEVVAAGVKAVVVHSSGFAEVGGDGAAVQAEMASMCRQAGVGLIGPNCIGMVSYPSRVCLSGATVRTDEPAGSVGFVTQSGAVGILAMHSGRQLRFSHVVSTGNEAVLAAEDVIGWLVDDPDTQVIGAFIEQVRDPDRFIAAASSARAAAKPIVMLKAGRSDAGRRAALSHTGALVGSAGALSAVCRRLGVIEVEDFDELFETLVLFSTVPERPRGPRTAFAGLSGGEASVLADTAEAVGLPLSRPPAAAPDGPLRQNPIDLAVLLGAGETYDQVLSRALRMLQDDDGVDQICLAQDVPSGYSDGLLTYIEPFLAAVEAENRPGRKPVVLVSASGGTHPTVYRRAAAQNLPVLEGMRPSLAALRNLGGYTVGARGPAYSRPRADPQRRSRIAALAERTPGHSLITELASMYGIARPAERLVRSESEAAAAAAAIGFPVVVKAASDRLAHRSDIGAVRLGVQTAAEAVEGYRAVRRAATEHAGAAAVDGVEVARQINGPELYVGLRSDPDFGPILAVSLGGLYVEVHPEIVELRVPPASLDEALVLVSGLRASRTLSGFRGGRRDHTGDFARLLVGLASLGADSAGILETVEINPLILSDELGPVAADLKADVMKAGGSKVEGLKAEVPR